MDQIDTPKTGASRSKVNSPCAEYHRMAKYWQIIDLVADGFESVKNSPASIIIQQFGESLDAYSSRLKHLDFLPLFGQLTGLSAAMLTRKAVTVVVTENTLNPIESHLENIDGLGNSVDVFIHDFLSQQLKYSIGFVMVDAPPIPLGDNGLPIALTPKAVLDLNLRPYWTSIDPRDVIGHKFVKSGVKHTLIQVRVRCEHREPDGEFDEKIFPAIKVYDLKNGCVQCRVFIGNKGDWQEDINCRSTINLPYIPFFCINTNPKDLWCARPDLYELAVLNINHTRVSSDLLFSLNLAAHPKLKRLRSSEYSENYDLSEKPVDMAPDKILAAEVGEDYVWLSAPSDGFAALERKIEKYESDAKTLWLATVQPQNSFAESGVSKSIGQNQGSSKLLRIAIALESLLASCIQAHFDLMDYRKIGEEPPVSLSVSRDLDVLAMSREMAAVFSDMVQSNQMTLESMLLMFKRGQLLPEDFDIEVEVKQLGTGETLEPYDILTQLKDLGSLPVDYDINLAIAKLNGQIEE